LAARRSLSIMRLAAKASCLTGRVSSNVRPHERRRTLSTCHKDIKARAVIGNLGRKAVAFISAVAVSGCSPTTPESLASLNVDSSGNYVLNGRAVPEARLLEELQALRSASTNVALEIWAAPDANHQVVARAVVAAQSAKIARIRFVSQQSK